MRQTMHHLSVATAGHDLVDITDPVLRWVAQQRRRRPADHLVLPHVRIAADAGKRRS
jgi:thiamine phosphate synthase YjbQ (UPF0047 family)